MPEVIPNAKLPRRKRYEIPTPDSLAPQESEEACSQKVEVLEHMIAAFEVVYPLEELNAITGFHSKEERESSIRQQANMALAPIKEVLDAISLQGAISNEIKLRLQARYKVLSRAVGVLGPDSNGEWIDIVNHTR